MAGPHPHCPTALLAVLWASMMGLADAQSAVTGGAAPISSDSNARLLLYSTSQVVYSG